MTSEFDISSTIEQWDGAVGDLVAQERRSYQLEELPGLCAGGGRHRTHSDPLEPLKTPLVVRRELFRGLDQCAYRHLDFWALYFVRRGRGTHVINGQPYGMARGNVYFMAPGSLHFYYDASDLIVDAFYFQLTLFTGEEREAWRTFSGKPMPSEEVDELEPAGGHYVHLMPERQVEVEEIIACIRRELVQSHAAWWLSARARLWCLLVQLAQWHKQRPQKAPHGTSMEVADVLRFCEEHFAQPLSVEQLAALTHFSRNHFTRVFTNQVGMSPANYVRYLRLQHAQKLLSETRYCVADIARLCGFGDETTLGRAFKRAFLVSPSTFRATHKQTLAQKLPPQGFTPPI